MTSITVARRNVLPRTATPALCRQPLLRSARPGPTRPLWNGWLKTARAAGFPQLCCLVWYPSSESGPACQSGGWGGGWGVAWGGGGPAGGGGGDSASADHICPETCFQQHERSRRAVPLSSQPGGPFNSPHAGLNQRSTSITPGLLLSFRVGR